MSRKHMPLLVGGLVVLLLAIVLLYLLFIARGRYVEGASGLSMVQNRLQRLSSRAVFPSEANVQTLSQQTAIYQEYLDGLYGAMREGQFASESVPRARFPLVLEEVIGRLVNDARTKSVVLPPDFSFGFQRYTAGNLPADEEVERLVVQLRSVATLCEILYGAGIGELISVDRPVFEKDAQVAPVEEEYGRRSQRNRPETPNAAPGAELLADPEGLFTREHYALSFRSPVPALWAVLDRFSKGSPFVVLTRVEVSNPPRPAVVPPKADEAKATSSQPVSTSGWQSAAPSGAAVPESKEEPAILPRELRVVAGQELPSVRLEVDLYRFVEAARAAEEGEVSP